MRAHGYQPFACAASRLACLYASVLPSASQAHYKTAPCCLSAAAGTVQGLSSSTNYRPLHACGFLGRARTKGEHIANLRSTSCEPHCQRAAGLQTRIARGGHKRERNLHSRKSE